MQVNTPSAVLLAVQLEDNIVPSYMMFTSVSSCASPRSSAVGVTPARLSPPLKVAKTLPSAAHIEAFVRMVVLRQAPMPVASFGAAQPSDTKPAGQSVQVDVLADQLLPPNVA